MSTLVSFVLPLALTIVFYVQTALRIRKQYLSAKLAVDQMTHLMSEQFLTQMVGRRLENTLTKERVAVMTMLEKHIMMLAHHKTMLRAMTLIVLVYCICWTPLYSILFIKAVCKCVVSIKAQHTWGSLVTLFSWLGYASSG